MGKHQPAKATRTERTKAFMETTAAILTALTVAAIFARMEGAVYLEALAVAWLGATAVFHTLYARKESRANSQKYMEAWVEKVADKYGPDYAARFCEIVLQNSNQ